MLHPIAKGAETKARVCGEVFGGLPVQPAVLLQLQAEGKSQW